MFLLAKFLPKRMTGASSREVCLAPSPHKARSAVLRVQKNAKTVTLDHPRTNQNGLTRKKSRQLHATPSQAFAAGQAWTMTRHILWKKEFNKVMRLGPSPVRCNWPSDSPSLLVLFRVLCGHSSLYPDGVTIYKQTAWRQQLLICRDHHASCQNQLLSGTYTSALGGLPPHFIRTTPALLQLHRSEDLSLLPAPVGQRPFA